MVKRFIARMLFSTVFLLLFSTKFIDVTVGERLSEYPLETAWQATGIPLREVNTEAWLRLNERRLSLYELKELAEEIQRKLGLKLKTKILTGEGEDFGYVSYEGVQSDGTNVSITIQSTRSDGISETQLGIYTVHFGEMKDLRQYIKNLQSKIVSLGSHPDFNVVFVGERLGKLPPPLVRELSGRAFRKLNAELVDSAFENGNSHQKGFSSLIKESIEIDTRRVNVEFDTRYDQVTNMTQITLASPRTTAGV